MFIECYDHLFNLLNIINIAKVYGEKYNNALIFRSENHDEYAEFMTSQERAKFYENLKKVLKEKGLFIDLIDEHAGEE